MPTKYKADTIRREIKPVQVLRETEKRVYLHGYGSSELCEHKETGWHAYCDTWEQAKAWLVSHYAAKVEVAERRLEWESNELAKVQALEPLPTGGTNG